LSDIKIKNLYKIYGSDPHAHLYKVKNGMSKQQLRDMHDHILALDNINLHIMAKTFQVIIGLEESGKTTLMKLLSKTIIPTDGELFINGTTAMLNGQYNLFKNKTVLENIMYGVDKAKTKKAIDLLDNNNLLKYKNEYPIVLKKGIEQKVGLIRAFVKDSDILLLDECTQYVDESTQDEMLDMVINLHKEYKKTIVFISHNLKETLKIADRIAILDNGVLEQEGTPNDILQNPKTKHIIGGNRNDL
tara:strand:+ start:99 stop:836 length:738 start_codon:yes stop_codon:yes gene_type:complete